MGKFLFILGIIITCAIILVVVVSVEYAKQIPNEPVKELNMSQKNPYWDLDYNMLAVIDRGRVMLDKDMCQQIGENEDYYIFNCTCLFPDECDT